MQNVQLGTTATRFVAQISLFFNLFYNFFLYLFHVLIAILNDKRTTLNIDAILIIINSNSKRCSGAL